MTQDSPDNGGEPDERTVSLSSETQPASGPVVAQWPLDDLLHEHVALPAPARTPREQRRPAYYVALTVAVMLTLGLVVSLAVLAADPPVSRVAGSPTGLNVPALPPPTHSTPPGATPTATPSTAPAGPYAGLAAHPLSTSKATMPDQTCALPTFDPDNAAQAGFYEATKVCADNAFGELLAAAELPAPTVEVVTVDNGPADTPCGTVEPSAPTIQCAGTVYMTPAYLRDVEGNDRFPGRYFGVFLREYARAVLETGGLGPLYEKVTDADDLNVRSSRQATCLAGIASGAMSGRGAVDSNITNEIRDRLSNVDAPPDAASWLDRGFQSRQLATCNPWT
jgi:hypothetical protein